MLLEQETYNELFEDQLDSITNVLESILEILSIRQKKENDETSNKVD